MTSNSFRPVASPAFKKMIVLPGRTKCHCSVTLSHQLNAFHSSPPYFVNSERAFDESLDKTKRWVVLQTASLF